MLCHNIMTPNPSTCTEATSTQAAATLMKDHAIGAVPVCDERTARVLGIVTDRDLCLGIVASDFRSSDIPVGRLMTRDPVTCRPDDDVQTAQELMQEHQVRRIPVVDEQGVCVGIISQGDIALNVEQSDKVHETVREVSMSR